MTDQSSLSIYEIHKSPIVVSYRLIIFLLGFGDFLYANLDNFLNNAPFYSDHFFTYQSNLLVILWLFFALIWRAKPEKLQQICGSIRGAVTVYISVTFIVYGIILAPLSHPTGIGIYQNIIHHYLNPFVFIVDFFITERQKYNWKSVIPWFVYPHLYLGFSFFMGIVYGDYIYPFLDYPKLGLNGYIIWYIILLSLFLILSVIYYFIPRYFDKKASKTK